MDRPLTTFLVILASALLLEVAYHYATVGALAGGDSHYPSAHELAREAGLTYGPVRPPPRPAPLPISSASAAPPISSAPAAAGPAAKVAAAPAPRPAAAAPRPRLLAATVQPRPSHPVAPAPAASNETQTRSNETSDAETPPF